MKHESLVVGLDVGTTKVCAVVGEAGSSGEKSGREPGNGLNIIGIGTAASRGIKKGVIGNIESTAASIRAAVHEAEMAAGVDIKAVHVGISGRHIGCFTSHGVIAVKEKEIGRNEVDSVLEAARAVALPFDREMLHVMPAGFSVNGQNGITDPVGMGGVRLETKVRIITCATTAVQNLIRSCQKAGLDVIDIVFQPLAAAETVLTPDEKDLGVAVIDIGGGTTDMALYSEGNICHASVLTIGGNNFTNDIAVGLRIPPHEAESLKRNHGCAMLSMVKDDEDIAVGRSSGKMAPMIPRSYLVEILQPRAEELFALIKKEMSREEIHKQMNSGVVLTGGAVLMEGMDVMAENILELPVRIGGDGGASGFADIAGSPLYSSGIGLALYGIEESPVRGHGRGSMFSGVKKMMTALVGGVFK